MTVSSPHDAVAEALENIRVWNPLVNAMLTVTADTVQTADGPLAGVPVAYKDCIDVAGVRSTYGNMRFKTHIAEADAEVVRRLKAAGTISVGKVNLAEFCYGGTGENAHFGAALNPWDPSRITGGSSSGTAAAVAAGMCRIGIGTDTGGSVRIPAALCGVVGLRPTVGRISNRGVQALSVALDTVGPMAYAVEDVARAFAVMTGYDPEDPNSADRPVDDVLGPLTAGAGGVRIGLPRNFYFENLQPAVERRVRDAVKALEAAGARLVDITIPRAEEAQARLMGTVMAADAADVHRAAMEHQPETFGEEVLRRLKLGIGPTAQDYAGALRWMGAWKVEWRRLFGQVDTILTPTTPITAPRLANSADMIEGTRQIARFTYGVSALALPGLSVPVGFDDDGLPIGMQLVAPWFGEAMLFRLGAAYQARTEFHRTRPTLPTRR